MPLTTTTNDFVRLVRAAQVSGNLDAPEGGFDAIMQAIVCKVIYMHYSHYLIYLNCYVMLVRFFKYVL